MTMTANPEVYAFFDHATSTFSYVVKDPSSTACAVIDPVLDWDYASGTVSYGGANKIIGFIKDKGLQLELIIETHAHADHLTAAPYLQRKLGGKIGIGRHITEVQTTFAAVFNLGDKLACDGRQFDVLYDDNDQYTIGHLKCVALHTPGHTPACMTHLIGDCAFVGDTIFMPDTGTARADFPGGDAGLLYRSIQRILELPEDTKLYMCHDYPPEGREVEFLCTVKDQKLGNIHVMQGTSVADYIVMRETRDKTLEMPRLILPSLQVNIRGGHFPQAEDNGTVYLKVPTNGLEDFLLADE